MMKPLPELMALATSSRPSVSRLSMSTATPALVMPRLMACQRQVKGARRFRPYVKWAGEGTRGPLAMGRGGDPRPLPCNYTPPHRIRTCASAAVFP